MKRTKTLVAVALAVMFVLTIGLAACNQHVCKHVCKECGGCTDATCTDPACADKCTCGSTTTDVDPMQDPYLPFAKNTTLRMATGYNNPNTGIAFDAGTAGEGITLADGKTYHTGDLKPTWVEAQNRLGMLFDSKWTGAGSADKEFTYWKDRLNEVDMVAGSVSKLTEAGVAGSLVDISKYLDKMPNFKAYLEANPIVRLSITSSTSGDNKGAIYFSPYFDGVNDIERMPLMRADWVKELLDGDEAYNGANRLVVTGIYEPYMPTNGKVEIESLSRDGNSTQKITKDYGKTQNIIAQMNAAEGLTGNQAVAMLRQYIKDMYGDTYANPSDLYLGYDAAWDADELVALLRCVVASKSYTSGGQQVAVKGLFCRETGKLQRKVDLFRFAGTLFGVRGLESRQDYLYFDKDGNLHDARGEEDTYVAIERMNAMYNEGLIYLNVDADSKNKESSTTMVPDGVGFMHYDYNQTQTALNSDLVKKDANGKYIAVMVPVARWNDGESEKVMRFTESWRSVKTDGWAISKTGIGDDINKLNAALKLIDYAYSKEGQILMSYGPDAFIKHDAQGNMVMFDFNGEQWPVIADETYTELWSKAGGNYTNYARFYLGSTLSFVKSQSFEYQCTHEVGREGAAKISAAIKHGTIKHPLLAVNTENMWYTSIPTTLPTTETENTQINGLTELSSNGKFSQSNDKYNLLIDMIGNGYAVKDAVVTSRADTLTKVNETWNVNLYKTVKTNAWTRLLNYYNDLNK